MFAARNQMRLDNIYITIIDRDDIRHMLAIPLLKSLTLFDLVKRLGEDVTCNCFKGNCKNCHITIVCGRNKINEPNGLELSMLDRLKNKTAASRMACQIPVQEKLNGLIIMVDKK